jgi:uncharacterized protein (TIGR02300 family)
VAKQQLGTKRICPETGKKFYDLGRDPVVSPYTGISYPLSAFDLTKKITSKPSEEEEKTEKKTNRNRRRRHRRRRSCVAGRSEPKGTLDDDDDDDDDDDADVIPDIDTTDIDGDDAR